MKAREGEVARSAVTVSVKCRTRSNGLRHSSTGQERWTKAGSENSVGSEVGRNEWFVGAGGRGRLSQGNCETRSSIFLV